MKRHWRIVLSGLLGLFFIYTGGIKLFDPAAFSLAIGRYQMTGPELSWILAFWIPWTEVLAGGLLVFKRWRSAAGLVLLGLMLVFQIGLLSAIFRGLDISCGCFGSGLENSLLSAFLRNILLIVLLILLVLPQRRTR